MTIQELIDALRQMPVVSVDAIKNAPTLTLPNEPLTLEQLRESPHGKIKDSTLESICNRANEIASRPPEGEEDTDV